MHYFEMHETDTGGELAMGGALTIENASAIRNGLLAAFGKADHIVAAIDKTFVADLAFLQIMCSACHTAAAAGKRFSLKGGLPGKLVQTAAAAGYLRKKGCSRCKSCLWITEEEE